MRDLARKLSKAGDLVTALCAGTCSTAEAYLLLDQRSKLLRGSVDPEVLSAAV